MHYTCKYLICSIIWILCCMQQYCVSQSTTVRPYKFGFTIDQQQHRSEKRDERGIVMGEFGFITADGIYHVTVYATDEQGRFRILAMRNYPYESPPKTVEVMVQPKIPVTTTTTKKPLPKHNFNTEACSGCFLVNGNNKPKGLEGAAGKTGKNDIRPLSKPLPSAGSAPAGPNSSNKPSSAHGINTQNTALANSPRPAQDTKDFPLKASTQTQNTNSASSSSKPFGVTKPETEAKIPTNTLNTLSKGSNQQTSQPKPGATATAKPPPIMDIIMQKVLPALMGSKSATPTTLSNKPNAAPSGKIPGSSSANDFNRKTGSSGNGDGDLYRFKYILDYHGHSETGKRNGDKEGTYFAIGDDNVERTIEYVANEFGYQPRIRWRKLNDNEIKSKENTLKDYEFIWFN